MFASEDFKEANAFVGWVFAFAAFLVVVWAAIGVCIFTKQADWSDWGNWLSWGRDLVFVTLLPYLGKTAAKTVSALVSRNRVPANDAG